MEPVNSNNTNKPAVNPAASTKTADDILAASQPASAAGAAINSTRICADFKFRAIAFVIDHVILTIVNQMSRSFLVFSLQAGMRQWQ